LKQIPNAKSYELMLWLKVGGEIDKCNLFKTFNMSSCKGLHWYKSGSKVMGGWVAGGAVVGVWVAVWMGWKIRKTLSHRAVFTFTYFLF
jgi:hypothetical protein